MTPTSEAGISICVYRPNQAKYRAIFSPKYFLKETEISKVPGLSRTEGARASVATAGGRGRRLSPHKSHGLELEEDAVVGPLFIQELSGADSRNLGLEPTGEDGVFLLTFLSLDSALSSFTSP